MKKSEINKQAKSLIKEMFFAIKTKEDYKKAIGFLNGHIPNQIGAEKFIWERTRQIISEEFGRIYVKPKLKGIDNHKK